MYKDFLMDIQPKSLVNIAPAIVKAIAETQDIVADSTNPFHKNSYASLSAHLAKLKPTFAKHGLAILQFPTSNYDTNGVGVKTMILHTSGEYIEASITLQAPVEKTKDGGEKSGFTGQQAGALISYLRRYALASVAGVATEDCDAETDRVANGGSSIQTTKFIPNPKATPAPARQAPSEVSTASGDIDPSILVPFGRSKGQAIGTLSKDDLKFWAETWEPRPYEKTGKVTKKDSMLKATAIALYSGNATVSESDELDQPSFDDVPF